jgi:arabinose-5-phosphate isomerase
MAEALLEMTKKTLGCVGIVNQDNVLLGMITDGDLRRHMSADLPAKPVQQVMHANPITISDDILGSEAVALMNEKKITNIFVVDNQNHPIGLIHMHHLLKAGVV